MDGLRKSLALLGRSAGWAGPGSGHARRGWIALLLVSMLTLGCSEDPDASKANSQQSVQTDASAEVNKQEVAPEPVTLSAPEPLQPSATANSASTRAAVSADAEIQETVQRPVDPRYDGIEVAVADIREMTYDDGSTVGILFSVPLDASRPFNNFIKVDSHNKAWHLSEDAQTLYMVGAKPSTSYHISVSPGIEAANGTTLNRSSSVTVKTSPAPASLTFASDGHILPRHGHRGLPVYAQNVPEANVSFFRVDDDKIGALRNWHGTRRSFYQLDNIPKFAQLVYEGRFELTRDQNRRRLVNLPIQDFTELSMAGVYIAVMSRPGQFDNPMSVTWFSVTDLGIHLRSYGSTQQILVHSLETTQPVAGASIELINRNGSVGHRGKTDQDGRYTLRRPVRHGQMLAVRKGSSVSLLPLDTAALDLSDFNLHQRPAVNRELFIWSPRDLYRGGETAHFSALLRDSDGKTVKAPMLEARLVRPDGQTLKTVKLRPQSQGYYEFSNAFAADAMTGDWRFEVDMPNDQPTVTYAFKIEDFMPERLKLTFNPGKEDTLAYGKNTLKLSILGEYLYGAPAAGNRLDATFRVSATATPFENWKQFRFGNPYDASHEADWKKNNLSMDDNGKLVLKIDNRWKDAHSPMAVWTTANLFETGGRSVTRRHRSVWLPSKELVGIRPLFKEHASANGMAEFELIRTDGSKALLPASNLQVRLVNRTPQYHWRYSSGRGWYHERSDRAYTELSLSASLDGKQPGKIQVPVKWGQYRLEVTDTTTNLTSAFEFEAGSHRYWHYADQQQNGTRPDQVTLGMDKESYQAGDVIRLSVKAPAAGDALVLVESDQLLWSKRIAVPAAGTKVDIPVDKSWTRHDTYISVLHLQPSDDEQRIAPTRAIGLTHLPLNRNSRKLDITLHTPEKWLPNRTVTLDLDVKDHSGKPVKQAWVTLAAVDVGVLSVTRFKTPDPFKHFFEPRRYGIDLYDQYGHVIDFNNANNARLRFGGDAAMARGGDMARSEVQIVSLFSGRVAVDNGKAQIPLDLPDFNGRLRLMAVAFNDQQVGTTDAEVIVAAPVVTQLSLPRFVAIGDQSNIALDITNLSGAPIELDVSMQAFGPVSLTNETDNQSKQSLTLQNQQKQTLVYPFTATYAPEQTLPSSTLSRMTFKASVLGHPDYPIEREWTLISRPAVPAETLQVRNRLQSEEVLAVDANALDTLKPESLKVQATLNGRANLNPHNQLDNLLRYPYGCLEQTLSSTWPWLYAIDDKLRSLGLDHSPAEQRKHALDDGLQRIAKRQMSHGGFGLWSSTDEHEQHWLTVHAADFLTEAQQQGIKVDEAMLDKALKRLNDYIRGRGTLRERWSQRQDLYRFSYQSYAAYVLARHQRISLPNIRKLAVAAPKPEQALPLTWLALAAQLQGDKKLARELLEHAARADREPVYIGDYGSSIRDKAVQARLLMNTQDSSGRADDLLMALENELRKRRYLSTQERNALYMAALEQEQQGASETKAKLVFGDAEQRIDSTGLIVERAAGNFLQSGFSVQNQGERSLGVELTYQGLPKVAKASQSGGIKVSRRYFTPKGEPVAVENGKMQLNVGDVVVAQLTVSSKEYRPDLLLVDLIPAGLELENQNLGDSLKLKELKIENQTLGYWYERADIQHQEYRDDRFITALALGDSWGARGSVRIHYLARAVTPGSYQIPAPLLEDMYDPEARAVGDSAGVLVVSQP